MLVHSQASGFSSDQKPHYQRNFSTNETSKEVIHALNNNSVVSYTQSRKPLFSCHGGDH